MGKENNRKKGKDLLFDMESAYSPADYYSESERRDVYYSALIKDIVKNNRTSQCLKCIFFGIVCTVFVLTCIIGMMVIYTISKKSSVTYSDIGIAITGFGAVLSSIIVLPQIIAKHLFPEDSESVRFDFIKENQKLDQAYIEDDVSSISEEEIDDLFATNDKNAPASDLEN